MKISIKKFENMFNCKYFKLSFDSSLFTSTGISTQLIEKIEK